MRELAPQCGTLTGQCHLCADVAVVGRVLTLDVARRMGDVDLAGSITGVAFDLVDVSVGDDVLVHLGFAIERVDRS